MAKQKPFTVTWVIDIEAESPQAAAEEAFRIMSDPEHIATCFDVTDDKGNETEVDLQFDQQRAQIKDVRTGEVTYAPL